MVLLVQDPVVCVKDWVHVHAFQPLTKMRTLLSIRQPAVYGYTVLPLSSYLIPIFGSSASVLFQAAHFTS